jgi:hypothetical protein
MADEEREIEESGDEESNGTNADGDRARRKKGSIPPLLSFADALRAARDFYNKGGEGDKALLGEVMGNSPTSSVFVKKLIAFKRYGLVREENNVYKITSNGQTIAAPKNEKEFGEAVQRAFLSIPVYRTLYDEYKGRPLPREEYMINTARVQVPQELAEEWIQSFKLGAKAAGLLEERADGTSFLAMGSGRKAREENKELVGEVTPAASKNDGKPPVDERRVSEQFEQSAQPVMIAPRRFAYVSFPEDLTAKELKRFLTVIEQSYSDLLEEQK